MGIFGKKERKTDIRKDLVKREYEKAKFESQLSSARERGRKAGKKGPLAYRIADAAFESAVGRSADRVFTAGKRKKRSGRRSERRRRRDPFQDFIGF